MRNPKQYIAIDEYERKIIIGSLNNLTNELIAYSAYTDAMMLFLSELLVRQLKNSK